MFTVNELKKIKFSKAAMGGYKTQEVDDFLLDITADYSKLLRANEDLESKVRMLTQKLDEYRVEEDSIKSALVSAKQLGDKLLNEANEKADSLLSDAQTKSEKMLSEAKTTSTQLIKDAELRSQLMIDDAKRESAELEENLKNQCLKERKRLDVMKGLVAKFKAEIIESYKQHIEMLKTLPDVEAEESIAQEPKTVAETITEKQDEGVIKVEDISSDPVEEIITVKTEEQDEEQPIEDKMPISEMLADVSGETITFSKKSIRGDEPTHEEPEEMLVRKKSEPYIPSLDIVSYEADDEELDEKDDSDDNAFGFSEDDVFSDGFDIDTNAFDDEDDDEDEDGENYGFFRSRK